MDPHVDNDTLAELKELMEDEFPTLIHAYLSDSSTRIAEMAETIERADAEGLRRAAHSLKGSSSNLGAVTLSALCLALEQQARVGDLFGAREQLTGIQEEFAAVITVLRSRLIS